MERQMKHEDPMLWRRLWVRADRGEGAALPGAGAPYEPPESLQVYVDIACYSAEQAARQVMRHLDGQGFYAD